MPFSASVSRTDARRLRPTRASAPPVWDHDPEGDAFIPPDELPAELWPLPPRDVFRLRDASSTLVRRGRHAPARDGSESPEVRRLRVRLAQIEPTLDDTRRDARLADRARRTAEAERDRLLELVDVLERAARDRRELEARDHRALAEANETVSASRSRLMRVERHRDALLRDLAIAADETRAARCSASRHEQETRDERAFAAARVKRTIDAATSTVTFEDLERRRFAREEGKYQEGYEKGVREGIRVSRADISARERTAQAAVEAASTRARDAENATARISATVNRWRVAAETSRRREIFARAEKETVERNLTREAEDARAALEAAEARESVFRARLETSVLTQTRATVPTRVSTTSDDPSAARTRSRPRSRNRAEGETEAEPSSRFDVSIRSSGEAGAEAGDDPDRGTTGDRKKEDTREPLKNDEWLPEIRPPPRMLRCDASIDS
jgi:hypothetical protein